MTTTLVAVRDDTPQTHKTLQARWSDMDFNAHLRNTAYLEMAGDVRIAFLAENGFSMREFARLGFGPVVLKDEIEYYREFRLMENVHVGLALAGLSNDGSRYRIRNDFYRDDGQLAGRVTSYGGWIDLRERKLMPPPEVLLAVMRRLPRTEDYQTIER